METENALIFLKNRGEAQISIPGSDYGITKIGGNFYEDYNYYFYLNKTEKRLDTLLVYKIEPFKNGLVGIQSEQEYDNYSLFTSDYKPAGNKTYWSLRNIGNGLLGFRDDKYYILDKNANETPVPGVTKIHGDLVDDRLMVSHNDHIGFIDSKAKVVIPFKYKDAKDFEDGMTAVKYDGTYKLIDVNGKVLVETDEDYINFFNKDDAGKRIYKFGYGNKIYNYKGEIIEED